MIQPIFPPAYTAHPLGPNQDAFANAVAAVRAGAGDGSLFWARRDDRLDCAVVLLPDRPLAEARLVVYVAMVAMGDGLGALVNPRTAVTYAWPDRIEVNGATVGGVRLTGAEAKAAQPAWLVLGLGIWVRNATGAEPGVDPSRTDLAEEGCGHIDPATLVDTFSRHFLSWVARWQDDGFAPVREAWLARARELGGSVEVTIGGRRHAGTFNGIDDDGAILLGGGGGKALALGPALKTPTWLV